MPLHPTIAAIYETMRSNPEYRPTEEQSPSETRAAFRRLAVIFGPGQAVESVEDRTFPGPDGDVPIRIYRPSSQAPLPALLYFHGGGFVAGDLDTHDRECRAFCLGAQCAVIAVDYRLAPEHPAPAALEDSWAALQWLSRHASDLGIDPDRLAIGGDSAGGTLAASACLRATLAGAPVLRAQVLIYPTVSTHVGAFPSHEQNVDVPFLRPATMRYFRQHYLGDPDFVHTDPVYAPLLAEDVRGLPSTLVITAEFDPLRDEGAAYAEKLSAAGVPTRLLEFAGMSHAFIHMAPVLENAQRAIDEVCKTLRDAFAR